MRLPPLPLPMAIIRNALDARRRMIDLADAGLPGEAALFDLALGLQRTKIAGLLVTSGLANARRIRSASSCVEAFEPAG